MIKVIQVFLKMKSILHHDDVIKIFSEFLTNRKFKSIF